MYRILITLLSVLCLPVAFADSVNTRGGDYAIHGYDTVAYFESDSAMPGTSEFSAEYQGAVWLFSSAEHRALFVAQPAKYAPQFGGFCAYAAANNALADVDPLAWHIVDGKLYLNYNKQVQSRWLGDVASNITRAESFWAKHTQ